MVDVVHDAFSAERRVGRFVGDVAGGQINNARSGVVWLDIDAGQ